jgi:acetoin utilization deacetylase AcuC-like enzyme
MKTTMSSNLNAIPVFYSEKMVADSESYSPSAAKPKAVVAAWQDMNVQLTLQEPVPATPSQFDLAHDSMYVSDVLTCKTHNGFGNCSTTIAQSLPWTTGAMLSAARAAMANGRVAVAPCSGFHHAGYDHGGGYCTFNGLMVTAMVLLGEGLVRRVGILDFDQHWGDGTQDIIDQRRLSARIRHYHPTMQRFSERSARRFLETLPEIVSGFADCDLVLYQAGADPHIDDPLGGWLTTKELKMRDHIVFAELARMQIPVAWNLAGGYQRDKQGTIRPVLQIHQNTMTECAEIHLAKAGLGCTSVA